MPELDDDNGTTGDEPTFQQRVLALGVPLGDGTQHMNLNALKELVGSDPEQTAATCRQCVHLARQRAGTWHGHAQLAQTLAALYEDEFDDDTLSVWVADELESAGLVVTEPEVGILDAESDRLISVDEVPDERPMLITVERQMLDSADIYPFVALFSRHEGERGPERLQQLRELRGRVAISFDIPPDDPREVWEVPEVRAYVFLLSERLPYLPYYFLPERLGTLFTWLSCLAPEDAWSGGGVRLDHPGVILQAARFLHCTRRFAEWLQDDPDEAARLVFGDWPEGFLEHLNVLVEELGDRLGDGF
ncbi:chlororespiratory reduction 6 domain-containing protein [Streptomyces cyaneus]|uniref:chlororespiratory reduction 6 domain-containing protein n=1 Tax=Streptomyces cyaneus TaxID=1904 RepID=UPI000FF8A6DA|nr:chlororespiratory reduction 6 domain-containing protein [Streptomyces cyaneus]